MGLVNDISINQNKGTVNDISINQIKGTGKRYFSGRLF